MASLLFSLSLLSYIYESQNLRCGDNYLIIYFQRVTWLHNFIGYLHSHWFLEFAFLLNPVHQISPADILHHKIESILQQQMHREMMKSCSQKNKAICRIIEFAVLVLLSYGGRNSTTAEEISRFQLLFPNPQSGRIYEFSTLSFVCKCQLSFTIHMSRAGRYINILHVSSEYTLSEPHPFLSSVSLAFW